MKYLLPPAFAVISGTAGTLYGCHVAGMSFRDVMIAGLFAFSVSLAVTSMAVARNGGRPPRTASRLSSSRNH